MNEGRDGGPDDTGVSPVPDPRTDGDGVGSQSKSRRPVRNDPDPGPMGLVHVRDPVFLAD